MNTELKFEQASKILEAAKAASRREQRPLFDSDLVLERRKDGLRIGFRSLYQRVDRAVRRNTRVDITGNYSDDIYIGIDRHDALDKVREEIVFPSLPVREG